MCINILHVLRFGMTSMTNVFGFYWLSPLRHKNRCESGSLVFVFTWWNIFWISAHTPIARRRNLNRILVNGMFTFGPARRTVLCDVLWLQRQIPAWLFVAYYGFLLRNVAVTTIGCYGGTPLHRSACGRIIFLMYESICSLYSYSLQRHCITVWKTHVVDSPKKIPFRIHHDVVLMLLMTATFMLEWSHLIQLLPQEFLLRSFLWWNVLEPARLIVNMHDYCIRRRFHRWPNRDGPNCHDFVVLLVRAYLQRHF